MLRRATALLVLALSLPATATAAGPPRAWVGGGPAIDIREAPWQVAVATRMGAGVDACGGSLVAADLVITAAHCVDDDAG